MSEEPHFLLGAYILGGLDARERRAFEKHLHECDRCRAETAEFAPLPALLSKADPANLESTAPAGDFALPETILARRAALLRERRRRRIAAATAGLVGTAAAVAIGLATIPGDRHAPPGTGTFTIQPAAATEVTGYVTLTPMPWGTDISLNIQSLPTDGVFTLRTMDENGYMQPAANWAATPDGTGSVKGTTSIPMPKLRKLNVVDGHNRVLATLHR